MNWSANIRGRFAAFHHKTGPIGKDVFPMATVTKIADAGQPAAGTIHWFNDCVSRSANGIVSEVTTVSPGLAAAILERNPNNRHMKEVKAGHYAADMIAGRWMFNGEPIIVSASGELNDGQHRMQAIIDANICLPFLFVFGTTRESRTTVDQGAARGAADYLAMDGIPNAYCSAGIARLVLAYEDSAGRSLSKAKDYSNAQIVARVKADPKIAKAAHYAQHVARWAKGMLIPSLSGAAFYILSEENEGDAKAYLDQVCVGENIKRGDPAFAVRSALSNMEKVGKNARLELVFRGWNAYRQGRKLNLAKSLGTFPALV